MTEASTVVANTAPVRVGLIGFGAHMAENLYPALRLTPGIEIAAVASRDRARAETLARRHAILHATDRWDRLVESGGVDAVLVSATPRAHCEIATAALAAGVHVFVEKPPAPDLAALSGLVNVEADASKTIGFVGYNFRFAALIADARDLIGETASLRCLKLRFVAAKPRIPIWECSTVEQAFLYAVGIHAIDLALNMLGPPLAVGASHVALGSDRFSLNVTLGFAGGAQAVLDLGNYSNRFECACELIGDDGRVARVIDLRTLTLSGASAAGVAKVSPKETVQYATPALRGGFAAGGYASALAAFFDAVRTGAPSLSPIRASLPVYKVIEQCLNCIP